MPKTNFYDGITVTSAFLNKINNPDFEGKDEDGSFSFPAATETVKGKAKIATITMAESGGNDTDMMTPAKMKAAMAQFGHFGVNLYISSTNTEYTSMNQFTKTGRYYISSNAAQITDRPISASFYLFVDNAGTTTGWTLQRVMEAGVNKSPKTLLRQQIDNNWSSEWRDPVMSAGTLRYINRFSSTWGNANRIYEQGIYTSHGLWTDSNVPTNGAMIVLNRDFPTETQAQIETKCVEGVTGVRTGWPFQIYFGFWSDEVYLRHMQDNGTYSGWVNFRDVATATKKGLMSWQDKQKLDAVKSQWIGTEAEYNALPAYDANTFYLCKQGYQITKIFLGGYKTTEPPPTSLPIAADITYDEFTVPAGGYNKCDWYASNVQGGIYVRIELNFSYDVVYTWIGGDMGGNFSVNPGDVIRYYKEDMHSQETIAITVYQQ